MHVRLHYQEDVEDHEISPTGQSRWLQLPERVHKLKPESDLTPIPGILKPQHHAADGEPDQS